jgi:hypothetical protein
MIVLMIVLFTVGTAWADTYSWEDQDGVISPNRRNLSNTPKLVITASQSLPKWPPSQSGSACRGMRSAQENAGAATPLVKFA